MYLPCGSPMMYWWKLGGFRTISIKRLSNLYFQPWLHEKDWNCWATRYIVHLRVCQNSSCDLLNMLELYLLWKIRKGRKELLVTSLPPFQITLGGVKIVLNPLWSIYVLNMLELYLLWKIRKGRSSWRQVCLLFKSLEWRQIDPIRSRTGKSTLAFWRVRL